MTWEPTVSEVVEESGGVAKVLVTNKNLLVVADVMVLHRGFAEANPKIVQGLVQGVLEGNRMVRDNRDAHLDTIAKAFKWTRDDARDELAKVHLSNLPENLAFFSGAIDAAGSFGGIYQSAVLAYGSDLIKDPPDADRFASLAALKAIEGDRPVQGSEGRDLADPHRRHRHAREAIRCSRRTSASCSSRTRRRSTSTNQSNLTQPRRDQADAAGQPGLDDPAARPRRQRDGRGVPQAGRRGVRAHARRSRRWSCRSSAPPRSGRC